MIETRGLIAAIEALDAAVKSSDVITVSKQKADAGLVTIFVQGDTASVRSAVDAGAAAARRVGELVTAHVIPAPADGVDALVSPGKKAPAPALPAPAAEGGEQAAENGKRRPRP